MSVTAYLTVSSHRVLALVIWSQLMPDAGYLSDFDSTRLQSRLVHESWKKSDCSSHYRKSILLDGKPNIGLLACDSGVGAGRLARNVDAAEQGENIPESSHLVQ
jgi:hypothetical protein